MIVNREEAYLICKLRDWGFKPTPVNFTILKVYVAVSTVPASISGEGEPCNLILKMLKILICKL